VNIDRDIDRLIQYAINCGLIRSADRIYCRNALLVLFKKDDYSQDESFIPVAEPLADILGRLCDAAILGGLIRDTIASRDLFDTALMGAVTPPPSFLIDQFSQLYSLSATKATDFFFQFSQDCNYIRRDRSVRDLRWQTSTDYGNLDITINLSKPEKDPRDIAAARHKAASDYPACVLCAENEGYAGRAGHPARQNLRIMPVEIFGEAWGFQYSPYIYYNEHCIVLNTRHVPMIIDEHIFVKLFDFVRQFPHYFVGSNADLPIVGGSILSHEHFQGGRHEFPMALAPIERHFTILGHTDIEVGIVRWPMSVLRLRHTDPDRICHLAKIILKNWRGYSDPSVYIFAETEGSPHNTITPIARKNGRLFELDLVLRNNITTDDHPFGVYHPHEELHNIKKENIGLIEVMGLAVLPGRLADEMAMVKTAILHGQDLQYNPSLHKHANWAESWLAKNDVIDEQTIDDIIRREIGLTFAKVLEHAGVFKRTPEGQAAFERFILQVKGEG